MTEDLVLSLSRDLRAVSRGLVVRRLAAGIGAGALASALLTVTTLGVRPDLARAAGAAMFWGKLAYTLTLTGVAFAAVERLARPAGRAGGRMRWLALPVALILLLAGLELGAAPPSQRAPLIMGGSAAVCPWLILAFSLPPLVGLTWALRGLAPTRLRASGLMVGLAAGGAGASAYALHCPEQAAPFLAVWYSLGMGAAALLGLLLGPRLLRW